MNTLLALSLLLAGPLGAPGNDDSAALQAALDAATPYAPVPVPLPAGQLGLKRPVLVSKPYARFAGAGEGVTTLQLNGNFDAFVVGPVGATTPDGFTYDDSSRPDLFGVLDASACWAPGQAWGFDTRGRSYAHDLGSGLQFGAWDPNLKAWDYYAGARGLTVEFAVSGKVAPGTPIAGLGNCQNGSAPWWLVAWNPAADGTDTVCLHTRMAGDAPGRDRMLVVGGFKFDGRLNRGRVWVDLASAAVGGWANGSDRVPYWEHAADAIGPNSWLEPNDKDIPFQIGDVGPPMPFVLAGLCVSNVPVKTDPGNDAARYLKSGPGVIGRFNSRTKEPGRLLNLADGAAGNGLPGFAVVYDTRSVGNWVAGFRLEDATVNGGGAVTLAGAFDPRVNRVTAESGRHGLGAAHTLCNYTLASRDCSFGGDHAAVSLFETIGRFDAARLTHGGMATVSETASSLTWDRAMVVGFGTRQRRVFDLVGGEYAGQETVTDLVVDGEGTYFSDEVFRVENTIATSRTLTVRGGAACGLAATGYAFRLVGTDPGQGAFPALIETWGFGMTPCKGSAWVEGPTKGEWRGTIDLRQMAAMKGPDGPGFSPAVLKVLDAGAKPGKN